MASDEAPRPVAFDLMSRDPDYYFVLTTALGDFASRERFEAEGDDNGGHRPKWADAADAMLEQIEAALSRRGGSPVTVTKGDTIRIIPGLGPERVMVVSHVEHHIILLTDPEG